MVKFGELTKRLMNETGERITLTFDEIEGIIGGPVTKSYFKKGKFISYKDLPFSKSVHAAGFKVESNTLIEDGGGDVTFVRAGSPSGAGNSSAKSKTKVSYTSKKRSKALSFVLNPDLPPSVTKDSRGVVEITKSNAVAITSKILAHPAYKYTRFVRDAFLSTKPTPKRPLTLEDIIHRLVIINQIDGINVDNSFGVGCFDALANSIMSAGIEKLIAAGSPIPNSIFRPIAMRKSISGGEGPNLFSPITKYIARTAEFVYGLVDGYPIYDGVLGKNLPLYITGFDAEACRKNCDYDNYCKVINGYLRALNGALPSGAHISNVEFDKIVWFSYKDQNKPQRSF